MRPAGEILDDATRYVADVRAGAVVAGRLTILACERHVRDLEHGAARGLRFNAARAKRALWWIENRLRFSKGEWAGKPFRLAPWQAFVVASLFGWERMSEGRYLRRFRCGYVSVARKQGKTELMAAIGLVFLMVPGEAEPGGEVYAAATTRDQASICWRAAASMVRKSPSLRREVGVFDSRHTLAHRESESSFRTVASDSDTLDGLNPLCGIVDEYHAHPNSAVYDVIESGMGARREPLMLVPTTAGGKRAGACWDLETDAVKILEGIGEAEGSGDDLFAFIARLDDGDDWSNEAVWPKANPNLGVSSFIDKLRVGARVAKRRPTALPEFLRKHMNLWTEADHAWLPMPEWDACGQDATGKPVPILAGLERLRDDDQLAGRRCVIGLDLSAVADYTAGVAVFPPDAGSDVYAALAKFWIPADTLVERSHSDRVPVMQWVEQGLVEATAGPVVDQDAIINWVVSMGDRYQVAEVAMDPHNATALQSKLMALGFTVVSMRQGWVTMSPAIKATERLVRTRKLQHGGNPVLRWMASNVHVARDPNDNLSLNKGRSGDRIDGIVSLCMGVARAEVLAAPAPAQSYKVRALA